MNKLFSSVANWVGYSLLGVLIIINGFSGIIAGVWLILLGKWSELLTGLFYSFVMPFGYSLVALPTLLLMPFILKFSESGNRILTAIFGFLNVVYSNLIILVWTFFVFSMFVLNAEHIPLILAVLWAYAVVMGPLGYMAKKEGDDNIGTTMGLFLAQISFVVLLMLWLTSAPLETMWWVLGLIGLAFSIYSTTLAIAFVQKPEPRSEPLPDFLIEDETLIERGDTVEAEVEPINSYCINCGKNLVPGAAFCRFCGNKI